jgi:predicted dehydrogenase
MHYENARHALNAGKHVLCEKATTSNAPELRALIALAQEKKLFFMEAMWTRFQPLVKDIKAVAEEGSLGLPVVLHADLSGDFDVDSEWLLLKSSIWAQSGGQIFPLLIGYLTRSSVEEHCLICKSKSSTSRLLAENPSRGPYPMIWAVLGLYEHPANKKAKPTSITGSILKSPLTGVDSSTSFTLNFTEHLQAQAILSCSITLPTMAPGVTMRYRNGNILVQSPIYRPTSFTVQYFDKPGSGKVVREETRTFSHVGGGWYYEADEVARCVRDGKLESETWGHDKSILLMEVFDEVRVTNVRACVRLAEEFVGAKTRWLPVARRGGESPLKQKRCIYIRCGLRTRLRLPHRLVSRPKQILFMSFLQ